MCDIEAYDIDENDIAITQTCGVISVLDKPVVTATQNITAHPGDTISVPVNITQNPGISTIAININYDTIAMTLKSVSNGEIFNVSEMYSGIISQTPYILSFLKPTGNVTATGNLAVLEFEINPDCEQSTYPVDIAVEEVYNFDETAVPFKSTKSHITVNSRVISGVTLDDKTTVYNGQSQFLELVGTLPDNAVVEWSPDSELIDAGIYPVTATIMARGYETLSLNAFLTIEPKTISSSELCALNKMYDGSNSATLSVGDLIGVVEGDNISLIGPYKGHFETSNAGQHIRVIPDGDFVLTGPDADNYIFNLPELYADITKIPVTVTANNSSKIHGASDPELTYDYNGTLLGNDVFKGSLEREQGEAAGEYAITQGSLYISDNYEIIFIPATFNILGELSVSLSQTVISADSETAVIEISVSNNYGLMALNLDIDYDNTKFSLATLNKGAIFDAEDLLCTDNGGNIRLTASSDEITSENGVLATLTFNITEPPMPGLYNISINSISANGKAGEAITALTENGSIKILGKIAGITLENTAFTYDGEEKTLEISGILPYGGNVEYTNNKHTTAGTYSVSAKITAENYEDLVLTADMTILPAPLYIDGMTAQNKSYDGTDRAILSGGSIRGIIENDDVRVLMPASGTFSSKNAGEDISVTPADFVITGTQASNYTVIYPELYADIGKAPVTVTATPASKYWGDEDPELTYTVSDGTLFGDDAFTGSLSRTPGAFAGTYEITLGTLEITNGDNYEINFVHSEFTILADETLPSQPTDSIITVSPVTSTRGRSASVILNLNNNNGISDISFDVIFDSSAMTSDQITTFWGVAIENIVSQSDNRFTVNLKNIPFNADDNRLIEIKFDIDPHAVIGEYPIKITNIVAYADSNISNVVCPNVGILTVRDFIYGDANGDYILDRLDLLCIAKHFSGWDVEIFAEACDVTADGKFDRCDLLRLAKYFSGYDVELG